MSQKCFIYTSESRLACGNCLPADVVICVSTGKVAPRQCADDTDQPFSYSTLDASVVSQCKIPGSCGASLWKYTICYDEDLILSGQTLGQSDISGVFCKGCLANWVEDVVGNEILVEYDEEESEVSITSQHGCVTTFPVGGGGEGTWWPGDSYFGDGSDGDRTVAAGQQSLEDCRNKYYENLTIPVGADLNSTGDDCCGGGG